jgi:DHA2 family multidrug resistance protein
MEELGAYGSTRWFLLIGFILASLLEVLDTTIINPVLPTMAGNLGCTTQEIGWVSTSYILANVIVLPMTAWLSRRFGIKNYILASITMFLAASVMCGLVHGLGQIIVWRLVQGAAGAPLISVTQAAIAEVFPKKEQTISQSAWALGVTVAPAFAPTLGGYISDNYSWQWIFFINVPLGMLAMYIIGSLYKGNGPQKIKGVDYVGVGLLAVGLGSIQYVLEEGQTNDWFQSVMIVRITALGIASTTAFAFWQLSKRNTNPIVDLRVLGDLGLSGAVIVMLVAGTGLYGGLFLFPLFSQSVLGFSALQSGNFLLVPGVVLGGTMILTGAMMQFKVPGRDLAMAGVIIEVYSMWLLGHLTPMSNTSDAQVALAFSRLGIGLLMLSTIVAGAANLKPSAVGQGTALMGLARQLGGSFGIALSSTYVVQMTQFHRYDIASKVVSGSPGTTERLDMLTGAFYARGMDMEHARNAAMTVLDGQVSRQAYTMAFNNAHIVIGMMFLITIPILFLMKRRGGTPAAAGAH